VEAYPSAVGGQQTGVGEGKPKPGREHAGAESTDGTKTVAIIGRTQAARRRPFSLAHQLEVNKLRVARIEIFDGAAVDEASAGEETLCGRVRRVGGREELWCAAVLFRRRKEAKANASALKLGRHTHQRNESIPEEIMLDNNEADQLAVRLDQQARPLVNCELQCLFTAHARRGKRITAHERSKIRRLSLTNGALGRDSHAG